MVGEKYFWFYVAYNLVRVVDIVYIVENWEWWNLRIGCFKERLIWGSDWRN